MAECGQAETMATNDNAKRMRPNGDECNKNRQNVASMLSDDSMPSGNARTHMKYTKTTRLTPPTMSYHDAKCRDMPHKMLDVPGNKNQTRGRKSHMASQASQD